jgi:hypothetical protein
MRMSARSSWALCACAAFAAALSCGRELPSAIALGSGPLAAKPGELFDAGATSADAQLDAAADAATDQPTPPAPPPAPVAIADAAPEAASVATSDAGPVTPDAGSVSVAPAVAGEYRGEDVAITAIDGLGENTERDPKARIDVTEPSKGTVALALVSSSDGSTICTLSAKLAGSSATIAPGQACFSGGGSTGSIETGSATFSGDRLVVDFRLRLELSAGGQQRSGSMSYHFDGRRR